MEGDLVNAELLPVSGKHPDKRFTNRSSSYYVNNLTFRHDTAPMQRFKTGTKRKNPPITTGNRAGAFPQAPIPKAMR